MPALLLAVFLFFGSALHPDLPESRAGDIAAAEDYAALLTDLLAATVTEDGRVRYGVLAGARRDDFRRVLKAVEDFDPSTLRTREQRLAFWINAYNVQMLQNIIETPDVQNIVDEGYAEAFFQKPYRTAGRGLSLDQIEHVILRGDAPDDDDEALAEALAAFRLADLDPRLHVGLNCAAVSCPRLRRVAFTPANVDAELDAAMRDFTAAARHFRPEGDGFVLSALLDWFGADFDRAGPPAGDYLLRFMPPTRPGYAALQALFAGHTAAQIKARPGVRFEYLWTVNRAD